MMAVQPERWKRYGRHKTPRTCVFEQIAGDVATGTGRGNAGAHGCPRGAKKRPINRSLAVFAGTNRSAANRGVAVSRLCGFPETHVAHLGHCYRNVRWIDTDRRSVSEADRNGQNRPTKAL